MRDPAEHRTHALLPALSCLLAAVLFGASTPVSKALLASVGPFTLAGLLYLGGALGVLPFAFRGVGNRNIERQIHRSRVAKPDKPDPDLGSGMASPAEMVCASMLEWGVHQRATPLPVP